MDNVNQLCLFDKKTPIETVVISPSKEMPIEVFQEFYRLSYFMELMERLPDGRVIWNENVTSLFDDNMYLVHYNALHEGWYELSFELPKELVDKFSK